MIKMLKKFRDSEAGAVTVDWVVLTAAVVGLAVAAYTSIKGGSDTLTGTTSAFIGARVPGS